MPSLSLLIYSGTMPLLKIYASTLAGFLVARKGLFPPSAARGASQLWLHLTLPCLIFANVVPAFEPENVRALGPLVGLAFTYHALGLVMGVVIRELCYVPRNFWQGLVVLCIMSNWASLPNAIVMSVTAQDPFDPAKDTTLGISYASIFIVCYHVTFWVFGTAHSISWDYQDGVPQKEAAECRVNWQHKPLCGWIYKVLLRRKIEDPWERSDDEHPLERMDEAERQRSNDVPSQGTPEITEVPREHAQFIGKSQENASTSRKKTRLTPSARRTSIVKRLFGALRAGANAVTLTLLFSLVIALVPDLKALFVLSGKSRHKTWHGPDRRPPLAFVLDTTSLLGGITVPLSLILLGSSFARLRLPRPLSRAPLGAMVVAALAKTVFMPIFGIFLVSAMTRWGWMRKEDKVERFVAMIMSGTPAAVNQLLVTGLYSPDGEVDTLSAFLFVQYVLALFTTAVLIAVSLAVL